MGVGLFEYISMYRKIVESQIIFRGVVGQGGMISATFLICSLYVRYMFAICSLYVRYMFAICSLYVRYWLGLVWLLLDWLINPFINGYNYFLKLLTTKKTTCYHLPSS